MKDFTLDVYLQLLTALKKEYKIMSVSDFLTEPIEKAIILRHDIDKRPHYALIIAQIEHQLNVRSTFYFRTTNEVFIPEIIKKIAQLGHEIGYHYEDLAVHNGNTSKAAKSFEKNLQKLRSVATVDTACMHGSPLSAIDNKKLISFVNLKSLGIYSEPYFHLSTPDIYYLTDTGRKWNANKSNIRDKLNFNNITRYKSSFDIIESCKSGNLPKLIHINIHPQRWTNSFIVWYFELFSQTVKNKIKQMLSYCNEHFTHQR